MHGHGGGLTTIGSGGESWRMTLLNRIAFGVDWAFLCLLSLYAWSSGSLSRHACHRVKEEVRTAGRPGVRREAEQPVVVLFVVCCSLVGSHLRMGHSRW